MVKYFLIGCSFVLLSFNFINPSINGTPKFNGMEAFDSDLSRLSTINLLEAYIDSCAMARKIEQGSMPYVILVEEIFSRRFFHGFSNWDFNQNWIASISQKISGIGLANKVQPQAILKDSHASCSQQVLLMMDLFRRKQISYRPVLFPHHYAIEVLVNDVWVYLDANMEPAVTPEGRIHTNWQRKNEVIKSYYSSDVHTTLDYQFGLNGIAGSGKINEIPAQNAQLFQTITSYASRLLWIVPLLFLWRRKKP